MRRLLKDDALKREVLKVREMNNVKFQTHVIFSFKMKIKHKTQNFVFNKPENMKISLNI